MTNESKTSSAGVRHPLSDEQIEAGFYAEKPVFGAIICSDDWFAAGARFAEAAHGISAGGTGAVGEAAAWHGLTEGERNQAVDALVEYGTGFVAPLFAVIEGIERKLMERNAATPPTKAPSTPAKAGDSTEPSQGDTK